MTNAAWPELPWNAWSETANTLHMWTQIVGKTQLALTPLRSHWWNIALHVTARGLATSAMPYNDDLLDIEFDFVAHVLRLRLGSGKDQTIALRPMSVADFYQQYRAALNTLGVTVPIWPMPVEVEHPVRFDLDSQHNAYDPVYAHRFWQVLARVENVLRTWATGFMGKVSPVNFYWGSFDLAMSRFSGRVAPPRENADPIQQEAYSHEVISAGFWPGNGGYGEAAFYCYAAPVPDGLSDTKLASPGALWDKKLGEFILTYNNLREQASPEKALLDFFENAYSAAAASAKWDRNLLDRQGPAAGK